MNTSARRMLATAAFAAAGCLVVTACHPMTRYRVLSTLFDGVPPPPGMEVPGVNLSDSDRRSTPFGQAIEVMRANRPERPEPPRILSVHAPVADGQCNLCHDMQRPESQMMKNDSLCNTCHGEQRREEGWNHGPINLGTCLPCHVPHRSQFEHLLSEAIPGLCMNCHSEVTATTPGHVGVLEFENCTSCHDPHRLN